ncbi:prion-like-(Q/N-rich) domain-bearing protein 25 [Saccostrea cucullata]|uniref:prion-like-(Q/N-rich) domain-bearing protein 25 n=1 Tax=Saccostrea cuccullata TaxID=36930 RepID=UPI002ED623F0
MTGRLRGFRAFLHAVILLLSMHEVHVSLMKFTRSICLEEVKGFIENGNSCNFQLRYVLRWLEEKAGPSTCESQIYCSAYFWYKSDEIDDYYWLKTARILIFNALNGDTITRTGDIDCSSSNKIKRILHIDVNGACTENSWCGENEECLMDSYGAFGRIGTCICVNDTVRISGICRKVDVSMGEPCTSDIQCSKAGHNRVCDRDTSTCLCVRGFTEVNGHCIRTDLEVNQTCWYDEQCNGTANSSVCRKNMCVCMDEHYFANGSCQPYKNELPAGDKETSKNPLPLQGLERDCQLESF